MLDEGKINEFDAPYQLLQKSEGMLRKLVEQTGKAETMHLLDIAKTAYEKSHQIDSNITEALEDDLRSASVHDVSAVIDELEANNEGNSDTLSNQDQSGSHIFEGSKLDKKEGETGENIPKADDMNKDKTSESGDSDAKEIEYTLTDIEDASNIEDANKEDIGDGNSDDVVELLGKQDKESTEKPVDTEAGLELKEDDEIDEKSKLLTRQDGIDK